MAIAFRAVGTATKVDTSVTGTSPTVAMPAGHVATDLLLMPVFSDNNVAPSTPAGWTRLFYVSAGTSTSVPYAGWAHFALFYRIDNGSLGGTATVTVDSSGWPTGKPYVLAWIAAYSGCDTVSPIGEWGTSFTQSSTAAQAHPAITTSLANDWLITIRDVGSDNARTFTDSVGTDVERIDTDGSFPASPSAAMYDSNVALVAGLQTTRTTTASGTVGYGSIMASIAIRPAAVAGTTVAQAGVASIAMAAKGVTSATTVSPWDLCAPENLPTYRVAIDWDLDGTFTGTGEDVTNKIITEFTSSYGRDQQRQLNPAAVGNAAFDLINVDRTYTPENPSSPLAGDLDPARQMIADVTFAGGTFSIFKGRIDDFDIKADASDRTASFTFLDPLNDLSQINISTQVYEAERIGSLINYVLDVVGWTGGRDIDLGATILRYWWAESANAYEAISDLVKAEGPPAIAFVKPDGTFVFHDRHHRIQDSNSISIQGTFSSSAIGDCTAEEPDGLHFTPPFVYSHGWRDIVNSVAFDVQERSVDPDLTVVWTNEAIVELASGESQTIEITASDPFLGAVTPVSGTDYNAFGPGTFSVSLSRDSGASTKIILMATGGAVSVHDLQLRAHNIPVVRTVKVNRQDPGSISRHGERAYPDTTILSGVNDADAVASAILLRYATRRPTVTMRVVTADPSHFVQILNRQIGDRIHITNGEMFIDDDFYVERITHTITRFNQPGRPPVHSIVFGCEKALIQQANPFRFDVRGAGFDQGVFDPIQADSPFTVFMFDQGIFDTNVYGT